MTSDQLEDARDLGKESGAEARPAVFVPAHCGGGARPPLPIRLAAASLRQKLRFNSSADIFPVGGNRLPSIERDASAFDLGSPCLVHSDLWALVKALDQAHRDLRSLIFRQREHILKNLVASRRHEVKLAAMGFGLKRMLTSGFSRRGPRVSPPHRVMESTGLKESLLAALRRLLIANA